jgi:hypothetical protein
MVQVVQMHGLHVQMFLFAPSLFPLFPFLAAPLIISARSNSTKPDLDHLVLYH